jgi:hypothetical protein
MFCGKRTFFVACVKNTTQFLAKRYIGTLKICLHFPPNTSGFFFQFLFDILKYVQVCFLANERIHIYESGHSQSYHINPGSLPTVLS